MPLIPNVTDIPRPPNVPDPTAMSGELYFAMIIFFVTILVSLVVIYLIIWIWGNPILKAKESRRSGGAIVQHFENSKIGRLIVSPIGQGAIRHQHISDGTLITTPRGINNIEGHAFVNSWNLLGISIPTFLIGGVTKLRHYGIRTRGQLEDELKKKPDDRYMNLVQEAYNFNDFNDILKKSKEPALINLELEYVTDYIESVNQHYTESEIAKEVWSYIMKLGDNFAGIIVITSIAIFITAIAIYVLMGAVK